MSLADYDLDPSTEYSLKEVEAEISEVEVDGEEEGVIAVSSRVIVDGHVSTQTWYAVPRRCARGIDGLQPAGDSADAWIERDILRHVGVSAAVAIGLESLAIAGRVARS